MSNSYKRTIVGSRGFVGESLLSQGKFDGQFNRSNIAQLKGTCHELMVFTSAPAKKWLANSEPEADRENLSELLGHLGGVQVENLVLISTVDVYNSPIGVDETTPPDGSDPNYYGKNRLEFEHKIRDLFPQVLTIRLPGLIGPGLRKNAIYDLKFSNDIHKLNGASTFQFYPMRNLLNDIVKGLTLGVAALHLTAEPLKLGRIATEVFQLEIDEDQASAITYDFQSQYAGEWGSKGQYQYSAEQSMRAILEYRLARG